MSLANAALYQHDTGRALRLYSRVKTPQAAWNQSQVHINFANIYNSDIRTLYTLALQIYLLLAEKGELDIPSDTQMRISNLTKALDMIALAMTRLNEDDNPVCYE